MDNEMITCKRCEGYGKLYWYDGRGNEHEKPCDRCRGKGKVKSKQRAVVTCPCCGQWIELSKYK